ncbi:MAG TPA: hypothetical protein VJL35_05780 [Gemmatimonadaceae bacterium]|jgi:hypothetical protein|nr:hypothetical protein [Gemmatimonadaceae bacterium]
MTIGLRYPPFAQPGMRAQAQRTSVEEEQLPSIDEFIDELPSIDDFLDTEPEAVSALPVDTATPVETEALSPAPGPRVTEEGWADGAWQSYNWGSLASLNRHTPIAASQAWGDTEWPGQDEPAMEESSRTTPAADEIADALDGMARRIRSGELVVDNLSGMPPEAAMAAALAVLLKMRG